MVGLQLVDACLIANIFTHKASYHQESPENGRIAFCNDLKVAISKHFTVNQAQILKEAHSLI